MAARFNDGILLQNSHSTFKRIFRGGFSAHEKFSASAVGYVSLLESLSAHYGDTLLLVRQWQQTSSQAGRDPKHVYGAVEVVGKTGRTQRVYFPIPTFVSRYWGYPEVQKVKDAVVLEVNRSSPEEKLSDYLLQV
ncbi:hypothetical protein B484DRAFT_204512 [Ochromonadaceae sp. CCMP2298]|nr:hypothetical protein B484DRAFT_204512 [Ochromonadaceae sp. CCMP2298]